MDHLPPALPAEWVYLIVTWVLISTTVFAALAMRIRRDGGRVDTLGFRPLDFGICAALVTYSLLIIVRGFGAPQQQHTITTHQMVDSGLVYLFIVAALCMFLQYRGIDPLRQFGITRLNPLLCFAIALGLLLCVLGFTLLTENLTIYAMHGKAESQDLIEFFLNAAEHSDRKAMLITGLLAVVVAPLTEETVFRGYLYGVLKRQIGGIGAGLLTAGLFAAMHLNLAALPALFVLAICLTLAYEATGSLLVNISMHALFNLTSLLVIVLATGHSATP